MVLLWGIAGEEPLTAVAAALREQGTPFFFLDQQRLASTRITGQVGRNVNGRIECGDDRLELEEVTAAYVRPYGPEQIPALASENPLGDLWNHARRVGIFLWNWADTAPCFVINRPTAMDSNHSKPWQLGLIREQGFAVPDTLITNLAGAVRRFRRLHGRIIYKSISSQRSVVSCITESHAERWSDLVHCPTQFQQWIPGTDFRVHIVGNDVLACKIEAEGDDYRYAPQGRQMQACTLPADLARRCRDLGHSLGLFLSGIDLRHTPEGEWFCFEVNPSPGFTFFGEPIAKPVARAIARALAFPEVTAGWNHSHRIIA